MYQKKQIIAGLVALLSLMSVCEVFAQSWWPAQPLTKDPGSPYYIAYNNHHWSPWLMLRYDTLDSIPTNYRLWAFWHQYDSYGDVFSPGGIYYKIGYPSTTMPVGWTDPIQLCPNGASSVSALQQQLPDAYTNNKIWVFYLKLDKSTTPYTYNIFYKTSINGGGTWSAEVQLTAYASGGVVSRAYPLQVGTNVWIVFERQGSIYYKVYDGTSWSIDIPLSSPPVGKFDSDPAVTTAYDKIWLFWTRKDPAAPPRKAFTILYKTSADNGVSWSAESELVSGSWLYMDSATYVPSLLPGVPARLCIAYTYAENTNEDTDVYYMVYDGSIWSQPDILYATELDDSSASLLGLSRTVEGMEIFAAWVTLEKVFNKEKHQVLFRQGRFNTSNLAVKNVTPQYRYWYKNYPAGYVEVTVRNTGLLSIDSSLTAYFGATSAGTGSVTGLPAGQEQIVQIPCTPITTTSGYFIVSATATYGVTYTKSKNSESIIMLTIPGDVNHDQKVNVLDIGTASSWWSFPKGPNTILYGYNGEIDINKDGTINVLDLGIISGNWNKEWILAEKETANAVTPAAPSNLTFLAGNNSQVEFGWTDNSTTEDGFEIWRSSDGGVIYNKIATVGRNITEFLDEGLDPAITYYYKVRAYNIAGVSDFSNVMQE